MEGDGKTALITGAAAGIGWATACELADHGWRVAIADIDGPLAELRAAERPEQFLAVQMDVTDRESVDGGIGRCIEEFEHLDLLVNNAGIQRHGPIETLPWADWTAVLDVNLHGVLHCLQAAGPHMLERGQGAVVNIVSVTGQRGAPSRAPYAVSKAAVEALTRVAAVEWASRGVRVNAVGPGYVDTPMLQEYFESGKIDRAEILSRIPARRLAIAADVAKAVRFLGSDDAGYITGQVLFVDGGFLVDYGVGSTELSGGPGHVVNPGCVRDNRPMDALVFEGPGRMTFADRPRPQAGPGEVVVGVTASGICGSEMTSFTGESTRRAPGLIFGHEFVGRVLRSGPDVPQDLADQLVAVNPLISCGVCAQCRGGRPNACPNRVLLGLHVDGGFAEEVAVPYSGLRPLGDLDELAGTFSEPLANAVHAVRLLGAVVGRRIAVFGAGPIGLCVISVLRVAGAGSIVALDPVESRRKLALGAGATEALTPVGADLAALGFDDVIDAAGVGAARRAAIDSAPYGATVVLLGMHEAETELQLNAAVTKELRLQCSYCYTPREFDTALEILRDGSVPHSDWITELKLAEGQQAFETLVNHPESATKIVLRP